jgi:hypothetical protein
VHGKIAQHQLVANFMASYFLKKDNGMKLEYAKDPIWVNEEHTMIDLVIKWEGINTEYPFTASANDIEEHGRVIFAAAAAGQFGIVADYVPIVYPAVDDVIFQE